MNWKTVGKPALVLFLVCLVVTAALSVTNYFTKDAIAAAKEQAIMEAMESLIPDAAYEPLDEESTAYVAQIDGQTAGYLFLTKAMGYKSMVQVMTALNAAGAVTGVTVVGCADESPGIGQKVGTDESFVQQFIGRTEASDQVDAITGATYSSNGVRDAVNQAIIQWKTIAGGDAS